MSTGSLNATTRVGSPRRGQGRGLQPELNALRALGYRITTAAEGLIMVTALGRPDMVTLREAAEAVWLVKESEPERPISPNELRPLVIDRLGPGGAGMGSCRVHLKSDGLVRRGEATLNHLNVLRSQPSIASVVRNGEAASGRFLSFLQRSIHSVDGPEGGPNHVLPYNHTCSQTPAASCCRGASAMASSPAVLGPCWLPDGAAVYPVPNLGAAIRQRQHVTKADHGSSGALALADGHR